MREKREGPEFSPQFSDSASCRDGRQSVDQLVIVKTEARLQGRVLRILSNER